LNRKGLFEEALRLGLELHDTQLDAFETFEVALYHANESMNLTRVPLAECWIRHFLDSILFQDLLPIGASVLDIGAGPGFPAWPLACARPDLHIVALDSSGKMLGFLRSRPLANLECVLDRAEGWGVLEKFDVVTGRAVAPFTTQMELSASPLKQGGLFIPMRTEADLPEIERLKVNPFGLEFDRIERRELPEVEAPRVYPVFRKIARTDKIYPRSWADMKRKPV